MTIYAVYESEPAGAAPVIVPERFSWFAALLPFVYAPRHRLWLEFTLVFFGMLLLWMQSRWIGVEAAVWIYIVAAVYFGFEAPTARGRTLVDRGYVRRADIVAGGPDLAELEYRRLELDS
jgi:hypothetical protein